MFKTIYGPLSIQWEVTSNCNYNCIHCYNYWRQSEINTNDNWSLANGNRIVDEIIKMKVNSVTITGGEPMLVFDRILPYIDKLLENGIRVAINTNAALIDDRIAEYLSKRKIGILISLPCAISEVNDMITNRQGSFDATVKGIKVVLKHDIPFTTNMVVSKLNQDYVIKTAKFIKNELGLSKFNATKASRPLNAGEKFDKYAMDSSGLQKMITELIYIHDELGMSIDTLTAYPHCSFLTEQSYQLLASKRMCSAGKTAAVIGYDGNVRACTRDEQVYGNLQEDSLSDCWRKMDEWRNGSFLPDECKRCNRKTRCLGGCRVEALVENHSKKATDPCMDYKNVPIKFKNVKNIIEFSDSCKFKFQTNIRFLDETIGIRATINSKSQFITNELYEFILQYNNREFFTKADVMFYFKVDGEIANELLSKLQKDGFLFIY